MARGCLSSQRVMFLSKSSAVVSSCSTSLSNVCLTFGVTLPRIQSFFSAITICYIVFCAQSVLFVVKIALAFSTKVRNTVHMGIESVIGSDEEKALLRRYVASGDIEWFDCTCATTGLTSAGLFRRMRLLIEQSLESGSVSGGINGVQTQPGRVDANPAKQP